MTAFAAQVPGQQQAEEGLSNIAQQGILGSLCAILFVALFVAMRGWLKAKDDRFTDQKAMADALLKVNEGARDLTVEVKEVVSNMVNEMRRSNDSTKASVGSLEKEQGELKASVGLLKDTQVTNTASLNTLAQEIARGR